jgi:hypothetical protein
LELQQNFAEVLAGQETRDIAAEKSGFGTRKEFLPAKVASLATFDVSKRIGEKMSRIAATNLDELILKARYAGIWDCIEESIILDLLAIGAKRKASALKEAEGSQYDRHV